MQSNELIIEERPGARGKTVLTVKLDGNIIHSDEVAIFKHAERERFIEATCKGRPGIDAKELSDKLQTIAEAKAQSGGDGGDRANDRSQSSLLLDLAAELELFRTPGTECAAYATIDVGGHRENWQINGKFFKHWLSGKFHDNYNKAPTTQAVQDAIGVLGGKAIHKGAAHPVIVRLGEHEGKVYLDLANDQWQAVEITPARWQVVVDPPVKFLRRNGMLALPIPVPGGRLDELRQFVNLADDKAWALVAAWLVGTLRSIGPYPILAVNGEQGSAKSTLCRMLRELIDPSVSNLRAAPRGKDDLIIAANNSWLVAFDNLSHIDGELSDALCRLSTGGGLSKRELYSDGDEKIFNATRPVLLNGIDDVVSRSDLLDRCIMVTLPSFPSGTRKTEQEIWKGFNEAKPRLLGALLDAAVMAMKNWNTVRLENLPRMADFALWAVAAERSLGVVPGGFIDAYNGNRETANELALEASAIGPAILSLMENQLSWQGTVKDLLGAIGKGEHSDENTRRRLDWPRTPKKLAGDLRRLAPNLRAEGIEADIAPQHTNSGRLVTLEKVGKRCSQRSQCSLSPVYEGENKAGNMNIGEHREHCEHSNPLQSFGGVQADRMEEGEL